MGSGSSRSKSMDAPSPPARAMATPPSAVARTAMPAERIRALEAMVEELRGMIRQRDDKIARQDNELKYRAKRLAEASVAAAGSSPTAIESSLIVHRRAAAAPAKAVQDYPAQVCTAVLHGCMVLCRNQL